VSDVVPLDSPADVATAAEPAPSRKARASRKMVAAKAGKKPSSRKTQKGAGGSGATAQVKMGRDTITVPKTLATNLTSKDLKKLRAILKRARKRGKKRSAKSAKKSA
jgi:hypothetical protein